jgi:hypothetical protein
MAGAEGIFFYTYLHSTRYDVRRKQMGQWPYQDAKELPKVAPEMWQSAVRCVQEMKVIFELMIDATPSATVRLAERVPGIAVQSWDAPSGTLILLSNGTYEAHSIQLVGMSWHRAVQRLQHDRWDTSVATEDSTLMVTLPGPGGVCLLLPRSDAGKPSTATPQLERSDGTNDLRVGGAGL